MKPEVIRGDVVGLLRRIAPEADLDALRGDRALRAQIDIDSMDSLNILAGLADVFGIAVPETDYGRLQTLDDIVAYVAERTGSGGG